MLEVYGTLGSSTDSSLPWDFFPVLYFCLGSFGRILYEIFRQQRGNLKVTAAEIYCTDRSKKPGTCTAHLRDMPGCPCKKACLHHVRLSEQQLLLHPWLKNDDIRSQEPSKVDPIPFHLGTWGLPGALNPAVPAAARAAPCRCQLGVQWQLRCAHCHP